MFTILRDVFICSISTRIQNCQKIIILSSLNIFNILNLLYIYRRLDNFFYLLQKLGASNAIERVIISYLFDNLLKLSLRYFAFFLEYIDLKKIKVDFMIEFRFKCTFSYFFNQYNSFVKFFYFFISYSENIFFSFLKIFLFY